MEENNIQDPLLPGSDAEETAAVESLSFSEPLPVSQGPAAEEMPVPEISSLEFFPPQDADTDTPELSPEVTEDTILSSPSDGSLPEGEPQQGADCVASSVDLSVLDDPELEEVLYAPEPETPAPDLEFQEHNTQEFQEMMDAPQPEQTSPEVAHLPRKGRPKRKRGEGLFGIPNILATVVWLALILAIGVTAGRMLWICAADVLAFGRDDKPVTITVYESDSMEDIIGKLHSNGLIRYPSLFRLYAGISHAEEDIDPGIYDLNTRYDYHALVNMMSASSSRTVVENVLIPEGYTCRQIFALLEEKRICTAQDLAAYAANGELDDYWFLEGVERGNEYCLEGYLFPDTYDFYKNSTPREVLEKLLNNFDHRFDEDMRAKLETLRDEGIDYSVQEITIIASMIEKEAAAPSEAANISGVIYNRLFHWDGTPAYLNIDASIVYALGGKTDLTREDLQIDSPYNTYTHTGLTPTPISNPGLSSLQAALEPASHDYYYYVLNPATGMHTFSTTYEEHSANVAAYTEAQ